MTARKPIVYGSDGLPQQIQSGDTLNATVLTPAILSPLTNANAGAITVGQAAYLSAAGSVDLAVNNSTAVKAEVVGLVYDTSIATSGTGNICTNGVVTSTDWTVVTGSTTLTVGALYFLDATVGKLTASPTSTAGQYLTFVGQAVSTTIMHVRPTDRILL